MKATGIVRRIDELGRVVIPKEIRRTLRIREGDPLEIFTDRDGEVILKKYSPIGELGDFAKEYAESLYQALGHTAVICDKDAVIAVAGGSKRELMDKPISEEVERLMKTRERGTFSRAQGNMIPLFSGDNGAYQSGVVVPHRRGAHGEPGSGEHGGGGAQALRDRRPLHGKADGDLTALGLPYCREKAMRGSGKVPPPRIARL